MTEVKNCIIWGNHSSSQFPDVAHGTVGGTPIPKAVNDEAWLKGEFIATVQQRGAAIIKVGPWRGYHFMSVSCLMPNSQVSPCA